MERREVLINTLRRLISTSRQIAVSATYGQLATFKVNTEKSSIGFIQCFLSGSAEQPSASCRRDARIKN